MELEVLKRVIARILLVDPNEITPETTFLSDLGADSLDLYQILAGVEEELGVDADIADIEKIVTVNDAVLLMRKMAMHKQ